MATRYGLDDPQGWFLVGGRLFCTPTDWPWDPPSLLYKGYLVSFLAVNRLGCGFNHPPPSSVKVTKRAELYRYSPSGLSWPVLGWTFYSANILTKYSETCCTPCIRFPPPNAVYFIMLPILIHKIFTLYTTGALKFECSTLLPKG